MGKLVERLDENGVVVEDNGPQKENMSWHKYQWRLYVSYQKLNQVTLPFDLPIIFCNYAVQNISIIVFIGAYMYSGYW